jgi:hypothetical protein
MSGDLDSEFRRTGGRGSVQRLSLAKIPSGVRSPTFSQLTSSCIQRALRRLGQLESKVEARQVHSMLRLFIRTVVWLVRAVLRSRDDLVLENLALRQQLAIYVRQTPQPRLTDPARAFWVELRAAWPRWRNALILVEPDTVVRWHRQGFAWFWRWKSRAAARRHRSPARRVGGAAAS